MCLERVLDIQDAKVDVEEKCFLGEALIYIAFGYQFVPCPETGFSELRRLLLGKPNSRKSSISWSRLLRNDSLVHTGFHPTRFPFSHSTFGLGSYQRSYLATSLFELVNPPRIPHAVSIPGRYANRLGRHFLRRPYLSGCRCN